MANDRCGKCGEIIRLDPVIGSACGCTADLKSLTVGNVTQWNGAWTIIGEVPAEAGKLVASTVFHGMLFLAFEGGLWCVMGGKLRKVTIDNA